MNKNEQDFMEFRVFLKKQNAAQSTILSYVSAVRQYFSFYDKLSIENLQSYRQYLLDNYKINTVNSRIRGMNRYLSSLSPDSLPEALQKIDTYKLPSVKKQQKSFLDTIITNEDYSRLKHGLKCENEMFWYFIIRFLAATGARISELTQIKFEYLSLGYMDLCSKGGKVRRIYFPESLCAEALSWFSSNGASKGFLFVNHRGIPLTPRGISNHLKLLAKQDNIEPERVYPHSFRHLFAKNFLKKFNDISLLADLMGHESIETTRIYLTSTSQEQQSLIDEIVTW